MIAFAREGIRQYLTDNLTRLFEEVSMRRMDWLIEVEGYGKVEA